VGIGFLDFSRPVGQNYAITFDSEKKALDHADSWDTKKVVKVVAVNTNEQYASKDDCVNAGLPRW
jgi:hypothetical protein